MAEGLKSATQRIRGPQLAGPFAGPPYGTGATVWAVLLFLPFIALIAALGLRSQERRPKRRQASS